MPTQNTYFSFVLCTFILFACNSKKQNDTINKSVSIINSDTVNIVSDEAIHIASYNTNFEQTITQTFSAAANKISIITAKKGLKVTVDPEVLEKEDGSSVDGKIKVKIIELTNINDLFKSNAATISNGKLLASGGSYFVGMECNGQNLHIKKGKSLEMQFPKLKNEEMEVFYGDRSESGNMNWIQAGLNGPQKLVSQAVMQEETDELTFTDDNRYRSSEIFASFMYDENKQPKLYKTLNAPVYYYQNKITIKDLVDSINRNEKRIYIDTIDMWPKPTDPLKKGQYIDTNYLTFRYGPRKQFKLITYQYLKEKAEREERERIAKEEAVKKWVPQSIQGQLQKYYTPSKITFLGWINCDRFYNNELEPETYFDLPITLNKENVNYFLLFRSFNGLLSNKVQVSNSKIVINQLPSGAETTIIAFTKIKGQIFHCKQEFIVDKKKNIALDFKPISNDEMKKIFGGNIKI